MNQTHLCWEIIEADPNRAIPQLARASVPGGWLVVTVGGSLAFVPDESHGWSVQLAQSPDTNEPAR